MLETPRQRSKVFVSVWEFSEISGNLRNSTETLRETLWKSLEILGKSMDSVQKCSEIFRNDRGNNLKI